jgi:hypothetical protein
MIAAAVAGADVVDVAIDSKSIFDPNDQALTSIRYVWTDFSAFYGRCLHGVGANYTWDRHSLCGYPGIESLLESSEAVVLMLRSECSRLRL